MKILLAAYGGGHINIIINLYFELRKRGVDPVVFGLTMGIKKLNEYKIPYLSYESFLEDKDHKAIELGKELCSGMSLNDAIPYSETVAYMGINYAELIEQYGKDGAADLYKTKGRQAFKPKNFVKRVLDTINPDLVISTNSPRTEECLIREANGRKIPTYVVNDFYDESEIEARTGDPTYCRKIFVTLEKVRKELISRGWSPERVLLFGNPAFDQLFKPISLSSEEYFKNSLSITDDSKVILWVKSVFPKIKDLELETEKKLIAYLGDRKDIKLLIKPHPNDPIKYTSTGNYKYITDEVPLQDLVKKSNLVITVNSTVGLEASILGKAVIQMATFQYPEKVPFEKLGIGKEVHALSELEKYVDTMLSRGKEKEVAQRMQKASPLIINEILADIKIL